MLILLYSAIIYTVLFEGVSAFRELMLNDWLTMKEVYPHQIFDALNFIKETFYYFLLKYSIVWNLRFILMWFPNVNPYIQPFYILMVATQPYLQVFEDNIPRVFGINFSFVIAGLVIDFLISYLPTVEF